MNFNSTPSQSGQHLWLETDAIDAKEIRVQSLNGREAVSRPYRFEIGLVSTHPIRASDVIGQRATLGIDVGSDKLAAAGVVMELHGDDPTPAGDFVYRLVLAPRLQLLDFTRQNQIFGTEDAVALPAIIQQALDGTLARQSGRTNATSPVPTELRLIGNYRSRDHVVQYRESDLAFLSRLCEHAGVFFFFEQGEAGEKVVFGDNNIAFSVADLPHGLGYRRGHLATAEAVAITSLRCEEKALPQRVYLSEYNEDMPSMELLSHATVAPNGIGTVVEYGQYFLTPDEGNRLAEVRAQEIACRGCVLHGESTAPQLRPGYVFTLKGHPDARMDGRFIVIEVEHDAAVSFALGQGTEAAPQPYRNRFQAIPFDTAFRPQRLTPKPVAAGLYNAKVDGPVMSDRAQLDEHGRYKLRLLYDDGMSPDGQATTYVRKAQPYAGKGDSGMHFPLLKGTEVVLAFVNGDPDRPIIVGAVPNPLTPNVVTGTNQTRNRIATTSGAMLEIEDGPARTAATQSGVPAQNHYAMGSAPSCEQAVGSSNVESAPLPVADHFDASDYKDDGAGTASQWARLSVPGTNNDGAAYLRLGINPTSPSDTAWSPGIVPTNTAVNADAISNSSTFTGLESSNAANKGRSQAGDSEDSSNAKAIDAIYNDTIDPVPQGASSDYAKGVLIGTNDNLMVTAEKSALFRVKQGMSTLIDTQDSNTQILNGGFIVSATNGIEITSGSALDATGHKQSAAGPTNIILSASGYVRTHSSGSSYFWSDSDSVTKIHGNKYQTVIGDNTSLTNGLNKSTVIGRDESYKWGGRLAINGGSGMSIFMAVDMKIFVGADISYGVFNLKMVTGADMKFVAGLDMKMVTCDMKIVTVAKYEIATMKNKWDGWKVSSGGIITRADGTIVGAATLRTIANGLEAAAIGTANCLAGFYGIM